MKCHMSRTVGSLALSLLAACRPAVPVSELRVTDGKAIGDDDRPAIVQISAAIGGGASASCTATWVSANTIITAAHCLYDQGRKLTNVVVSRGAGKGAKAIKVLTHPKYVDSQTVPIDSYDVGVLVFPANSSPEYIPVAPAAPAANDGIVIVGYGKYDHANGSSGGQKRIGSNNISEIDRQGRLTFEGTPRPTTGGQDGSGQNVVNSQGDSGGPMLFNERIIGVSSSVDANLTASGELRGHYENLRHGPIESWLRSTIAEGAVIKGLAGDDAAPSTGTPPTLAKNDVQAMVADAADGELSLVIASGLQAKTLRYAKFDTLELLNAATSDAADQSAAHKQDKAGRAYFETKFAVPAGVAYLRLVALDAAGQVVAERKVKVTKK